MPLLHPEAPLGNGAEIGREAVEDEQLLEADRVFLRALLERLDMDAREGTAVLDEPAHTAPMRIRNRSGSTAANARNRSTETGWARN